MNFEEILLSVGAFGKYQKSHMVLLCFCMIVASVPVYVQLFAAGESDHWCQSWPEEDCQKLHLATTECVQLKKVISIPNTLNTAADNVTVHEECVKYNLSNMSFDSAMTCYDDRTDDIDLDVIPCDEGWVFDRSTYPSTMVEDFELVCERSYLPPLAQSAFFAGQLISGPIMGAMSDRFGRRWTLLFCITLITASGTAIGLSPNVWMYIALRFIVGFSTRGISLSSFVIVCEMVSISMRMAVANVFFTFAPLGHLLLLCFAKFIPNWRLVHLAITLPNVPLLIFALCFAPESVLWLVSKNRLKDAEKVVAKMATRNKRELPIDLSKNLKELSKVQESSGGKWQDLLRSRIMFLIVVINSFIWIVHSFVYYGLSFSTSDIGIDPYIAFAISMAVEFPAFVVCWLSAEKLGCKLASAGSMIIVGIICCLAVILPEGIIRLVCVTIGKFFGTITFTLSYIWSTAMFPTFFRSRGLGLLSMVSRIGGISVPMLLLLDEIWVGLSLLVIGILSSIGGVLCCFLPETMNKPLPATVQDVENLYRPFASEDKSYEMKEGISNPTEENITEDER